MSKNRIPKYIRTVVKDKGKRLIAQVILVVVFFLIWLLLYTNEITVFDTITLSVVVALLISTITTVIEMIFKIYGDDEYRTIMHEYFKRNCYFCSTSLTSIYPDRESAEIEDSLLKCAEKSGERTIKIFTPNLETMKSRKYLDLLKKCANSGVKIEICTLYPTLADDFHQHRVTKTEDDKKSRLQNMKMSLRTMVNEFNSFSNVDIRVCNLFPTVILFIIDKDCYLSFMLQGSYARDTLHMKFNLARENLKLNEAMLSISPGRFVDHFNDTFTHQDTIKVNNQNIEQIIGD